MNSEFDEQERSLTSFNKWRGIGDASSSGKWIFRDGDFTLVHYEVDPTPTARKCDPQTVHRARTRRLEPLPQVPTSRPTASS